MHSYWGSLTMSETMEVVYQASPHHPDHRALDWFDAIGGGGSLLGESSSGRSSGSSAAIRGGGGSGGGALPCRKAGCWATINVTKKLSTSDLFSDVLDADRSGTLSRKEAGRLRQLLYSHYGPEVTLQVQ